MTAVIPCKLTVWNILHKLLFILNVYIVNLQTPYSKFLFCICAILVMVLCIKWLHVSKRCGSHVCVHAHTTYQKQF